MVAAAERCIQQVPRLVDQLAANMSSPTALLEALAEVMLFASDAQESDAVLHSFAHRHGALLDLVAKGSQFNVENSTRCASGLVALAQASRILGEPVEPFVQRYCRGSRPYLATVAADNRAIAAMGQLIQQFPRLGEAFAPLSSKTQDEFVSAAGIFLDVSSTSFKTSRNDDDARYAPRREEREYRAHESDDDRLVFCSDEVVNVCGVAMVAPHENCSSASRQVQRHRRRRQLEEDALISLVGATRRNARKLASAIATCGRRPVLVRGARGQGKTAVIREVARRCRTRPIELVLDESADGRSLIGYYELSEDGQFAWRKGPVANAVERGDWVVVEDVERVPIEVLAMLAPLARDLKLGPPGRGCASDSSHAATSFRLIATTTLTDDLDVFSSALDWVVVDLEPLELDDLFDVALSTRSRGVVPEPVVRAALAAVASSGGESNARQALKIVSRLAYFKTATLSSTDDASSSSYVPEATRLAAAIEVFEVAGGAASREPDAEVRVAHHVAAIFELDPQDFAARVCLDGPDDAAPELSSGSIGRISVARAEEAESSTFALTPGARRLLERVAACAVAGEPCLLVGEPGCGKTTIVQRLASLSGKTLKVLNLSHATDSDELLGGVRPVSTAETARKLFHDAARLFKATFPVNANAAYLDVLAKAFVETKWAKLARAVRHAATAAKKASMNTESPLSADEGEPCQEKKRARESEGGATSPSSKRGAMASAWAALSARASALEIRSESKATKLAFSFVESVLAVAAREGDWILLDEINLAPSDVLQKLAPLLDGEIVGDDDVLERAHPDFRIFAAMNPAGDAGKRELPAAVRGRFTELFVREPSRDSDLLAIAAARLERLNDDRGAARILAVTAVKLHRGLLDLVNGGGDAVLVDGAGNAPRYSLRTLCRALDAAAALLPHLVKAPRDRVRALSLREGFELAYVTQLVGDDASSGGRKAASDLVADLLSVRRRRIGRPDEFSRLSSKEGGIPPAQRPRNMTDDEVALVGNIFWLQAGPRSRRVDWAATTVRHEDAESQYSAQVPPKKKRREASDKRSFVLTPTSRRSLRRVARALAFGVSPILLQGPTCAGKTTLVEYIAARLGVQCLRVNNHEHTDVSEYVGRYTPTADGSIQWQDGALAAALRRGDWLLLDELNLAPSEVLEALNRLLDDNRELRVAETGEIIKPASGFRLLATQNPAGGAYGGRKPLSRALRDRFVEIHVDELPSGELVEVVGRVANIPTSLSSHLVQCHASLQRLRVGRGRDGGALFEGRHSLSTSRDVLKWAKRCATFEQMLSDFPINGGRDNETREMHAFRHGVALLADRLRSPSESEAVTGEIAKSLGTVTSRIADAKEMVLPLQSEDDSRAIAQAGAEMNVAPTAALRRLVALVTAAVDSAEPVLLVGETGGGKTTCCQLVAAARGATLHVINCHMHSEAADFLGSLRPTRKTDDDDENGGGVAFEWHDGALVAAMRSGDWVLLDELNLADDAVLERLNSVLEPTRTISLAEKGGGNLEEVVAAPSFRLMATMNPGGDHGKRELSPALRSRFTEIWVPTVSSRTDKEALVRAALLGGETTLALRRESDAMVSVALDFEQWCQNARVRRESLAPSLTARDLRAWATTTRATALSANLGPWDALGHGAALACLDGLSLTNAGASAEACLSARLRAESELASMAAAQGGDVEALLGSLRWDREGQPPTWSSLGYGSAPFVNRTMPKTRLETDDLDGFCATAPTTAANLRRVLRACALPRAILLEGPPGVGKSALVAHLAKRCCTSGRLARVNLSEHADLADLVGADLPTSTGGFAWRDGPLLDAVKQGGWILLDELNLAPQPVLEGLNACLDYRAELFVPELGTAFKCAKGFRLFATQNAVADAAGRRLLPRSFLDRFTRVAVAELDKADLVAIAASKKGVDIERAEAAASITLELRSDREYAAGADVNARDIERWCAVALEEGEHRASMAVFAPRCRDDTQRRALDISLRVESTPYVDVDTAKGSYIRFGAVSLPRSGCFYNALEDGALRFDDDDDETAIDTSRASSRFPSSSVALEAFARAIRCRWPVVLVGRATGDAITSMASSTGATLWRLQLSPATDVADLLGGYEQIDVQRVLSRASARARYTIIAARRLVVTSGNDESFIAELRKLASALFSEDENQAVLHNIGAAIIGLAKSRRLDPTQFKRALNLALEARAELSRRQRFQSSGPPPFEFVDGPVVAAAERGVWLCLDDANLCTPSVLDRLNSLLEPDGQLALSDGSKDGAPLRVVSPHPSFRIFLCVDPSLGELSRAIRNRCVEVSLDYNSTQAPDDEDSLSLPEVLEKVDCASDLVPNDIASQQLLSAALKRRDRLVYASIRAMSARIVVAAATRRNATPLNSEIFEAIRKRSLAFAEPLSRYLEPLRRELGFKSTTNENGKIDMCLAEVESGAALDALPSCGVHEVPLAATRAVRHHNATSTWANSVAAVMCCISACSSVAPATSQQIKATLRALDAFLENAALVALSDEKLLVQMAALLEDLGARRDAFAVNHTPGDRLELVARRCRDLVGAVEEAAKLARAPSLFALAERVSLSLEMLAAEIASLHDATCPPSVWRSLRGVDAFWRSIARNGWPATAVHATCISNLTRYADDLAWPSPGKEGSKLTDSELLPYAARVASIVSGRGRMGSRREACDALATALVASDSNSKKLNETMLFSSSLLRKNIDRAIVETSGFWKTAILDVSFDAFAENDDGSRAEAFEDESGQSLTIWALDKLKGCQEEEQLLDRWAMLQIAPFFEVINLRQELGLLAQLHAGSKFRSRNELNKSSPRLQPFIRDVITVTTRSPADASTYTLLHWLVESGANEEKLEKSRSRFFPEMLRRWVDRLWAVGNTDNVQSDTAICDDYSLAAPKEDAGAPPPTGLLPQHTVGPGLLFSESSSILCDASRRLSQTGTPIVAVGARKRQLAVAVSCLRHEAPGAAAPLRALLSAHFETTSKVLRQCCAEHVQRLDPFVKRIENILSGTSSSLLDIGFCWALLGAIRQVLLTPLSCDALDPALAVRAERMSGAELGYEIEARAGVAVVEAHRGRVQNPLNAPEAKRLTARLEELRMLDEPLVALDLERPADAPVYSDLCGELLGFSTSLGSLDRVNDLATRLYQQTGDDQSTSAWCEGAAEFSRRLIHRHASSRRDVVEPFVAAVAATRLGLGLLQSARAREASSSLDKTSVLEYPFVSNSNDTDFITPRLDVVLQRELDFCVSGGQDRAKQVLSGFRDLARAWRELEDGDVDTEPAIASSGFLLRGAISNSQEDTESAWKMIEAGKPIGELVQKSDVESRDDMLAGIVGIFVRSTLAHVDFRRPFSRQSLAVALRRAALLEGARKRDVVDRRSSTALCVVLADLFSPTLRNGNEDDEKLGDASSLWTKRDDDALPVLAQLGLGSGPCTPVAFDAWASLVTSQLTEVSALLFRLKTLLERWPANAILERAARIAEALLRSEARSTTPNQLLSGIEILLQRAQDWQEHCAREFSLETELAPLRAIASRGRKAELDSWSALLAARDSAAAASPTIQRAVPRLDALVLGATEPVEKFVSIDMYDTLDAFAASALLGDFASRLTLLRALSVATPHPIYRRFLEGLCERHGQFAAEVAAVKLSATEPIRKALADEQRLARWDDRNFHALADCAHKSRNKIGKLLREYDEALSQPVGPVVINKTLPPTTSGRVPTSEHLFPACISKGDSTAGKQNQRNRHARENCEVKPKRRVIVLQQDDEGSSEEGTANPGSRYSERLNALSRRMVSVLKRVSTRSLESASTEIVDSIFGRISSFRENEKIPRSAKRRAVLDLIRGLSRDHGLSRVIVRAEDEHPRTSMCAVERPRPEDEVEFADLVGAREYNRRGHTELERLRLEEPQRPRDVTPKEAATLREICSRLSVTTLECCRHLASALTSRRAFDFALEHFLHPHAAALKLKEDVRVRRAVSAVSQLRTVADAVADAEKLLNDNRGAENVARQIRLVESNITRSSNGDNLNQMLMTAANDLKAAWPTIGGASHALNRTVNFLEHLCAEETCELPSTDSIPVAGCADALDELVEAVLVSAQGMIASEADEEKYYTLHDLHCDTIGRLKRLTSNLSRAVAGLRQLEILEDGVTRSQVEALIGAFANGVDDFLFEAAKQYRGMTKLFYVVCRVVRTLFAVGLCDKQEDKEENSGRTEDCDGTGMGDGELADDAKDVSNEITNEEQLLGTKRQDEPPPEESNADAGGETTENLDKDEAEDGVEMEAGFDGDSRDVNREEEGDDEDDGSDDDDRESVERELGDAGQGADAVDERLWNEDDAKDEDASGDENGETPLQASRADGMSEKLEDEIRTKEGDDDVMPPGEQDASKESQSDDKTSEEEETPGETEPAMEEDKSQYAPGRSKERDEAERDEGEENRDEDGDEPNTGDDVQDGELAQDDDGDNDVGEANQLPDDMDIDEGEVEDGETEQHDDEMSEQMSASDEEHGIDDVEKLPESGTGNDHQEETVEESMSVLGAVQGETQIEDQSRREDQLTEDVWGAATAQGGDALQSSGAEGNAEGEMISHKEAGGKGEAGGMDGEGTSRLDEKIDERSAPNPFRDVGDALKHWHRRLNISERDDAVDVGMRSDEEDNLEEEMDGQYEYARQDEQASAQALGGVGEEEAPSVPPTEHAEKQQQEQETNTEAKAEADDGQTNGDEDREEESGHKKAGKRGDQEGDETSSKKKRSSRRDFPQERSTESMDQSEKHDEIEEEEASIIDETEEVESEKEASLLDPVGSKLVFTSPMATDENLEDEHDMDVDTVDKRLGLESNEASVAWQEHMTDGIPVARRLCEALRPVLAPTVASRLRGDYRTGKRLSMRRVIDYIASGYRRDKIWMRRTKPAKRAYQIVVAIDDSLSMRTSGADNAALTALAAISQALAQLEAGELAVVAFGDEARFLHKFEDGPFQGAAAMRAAGSFRFDQQSTNAVALLRTLLPKLREARLSATTKQRNEAKCLQLALVISDGHFDSGSRGALRRLHRDAVDDGLAIVLLLLDRPGRDSLTEMKLVTFHDGAVQAAPYLEDYPFPAYVLLRDVAALPDTLALALKQWFEFHHAANS